MKKSAALLLVVLTLFAALAVPALAIDRFDPNEELSLTVSFAVDEKALEGAHFRLFRVADMVEYGELNYTEAFKNCEAGALSDLTVEQTQALCERLYDYLLKNEAIEPVDAENTDKDGLLRFPAHDNKLLPGLYLVTSDRFYLNGVSHEAAPFVVCLPYRGEDEVWDYDMTVSPKLADTQVEVQKIWQDKGNEKKRPTEVVVELIKGKDEKAFASVVLSEKNEWSYVWEELPGGFEWSVREVTKAENYKSATEQVPGGFRIINTYSPPPGKTLPQTGLLWWPVPVLACAGMLLFVLGWAKQRKHEE